MHNKKYFDEIGDFRIRYFVNSPKFKRNKFNANTNSNIYTQYKTFLEYKDLPKAYKSIMMNNLSIPSYVSIINDNKKFGIFKIRFREIHTENGIIFKTYIYNYFVYDKVKNNVRSMKKESFIDFVDELIELGMLNNTPFEWLVQAFSIMEKEGTKTLFTPILLDKRVQKSIMIGTIRSLKELKKRGMTMYGLKKIGFDNLVKSLTFRKLSDGMNTLRNSDRSGETLMGLKFNYSNIHYSPIQNTNVFYNYNNDDNSIYRYNSLTSVYMTLKISTNPERDYKYLLSFYSFSFSRELSEQCMMLGEKINLSWSEKRLMETHNRFSKRISEIKAMFHDNTILKYKEDPFTELNNKFMLLRTSNEYLSEGTEMNHCLYSNDYFGKSKRKECFILRFFDGENRGTAQIRMTRFKSTISEINCYNKSSYKFIEYVDSIEDDKPIIHTIGYKVSQFYSYGNSSLPSINHSELDTLLSDQLVKNWVADLFLNELECKLEPRKKYNHTLESSKHIEECIPF